MTEQPPPRDRPLNPDCEQGKHPACAGDAWDDVTDSLTACACPCHRPSTDALLGAGSDWLDGQTVDEYIDSIRDHPEARDDTGRMKHRRSR